MNDRLRAIERIVELMLTVGLVSSMGLLLWGLVLHSEPPLRWGIVLLMFTPVVRVVILTVGLAVERDWLFAGLSLLVLGILGSSIAEAVRTAVARL